MIKAVRLGFVLASSVGAMSAAMAQSNTQETVAQSAQAVHQGPVATLADAIRAAVDNQPEVTARWEAFRATEGDRRAAKAGYLPTLDVTGEIGGAVRDFDNRGWFTRDRAEVTLSQMLFDGFFTKSRVDQADYARAQSFYELQDAVHQKALEAVVAYEDVRQYQQTVKLAEQNLAAHQAILKLVSERSGSGVGSEADAQQAKGRVALAEANLLTEKANLFDVSARFTRIVGRTPAANLAGFEVASNMVPADLGLVLSEAAKRHPSLYAANANIGAAKAAVTEVQSGYYPRVDALARAGTYRNTSGFDNRLDPRNRGTETFVGVGLNYNLFRGGADRARETAATYRLAQAERLLDKACVDLRQTASISWNNVRNVQAKLSSLEAHRVHAQSVATAYEQQFYIGRRSLLDVLDSKNETFQSQRSLVEAQHELNRAYYHTLYAMGSVLDAVQLNRTGMPVASDVGKAAERATSVNCGPSLAALPH